MMLGLLVFEPVVWVVMLAGKVHCCAKAFSNAGSDYLSFGLSAGASGDVRHRLLASSAFCVPPIRFLWPSVKYLSRHSS